MDAASGTQTLEQEIEFKLEIDPADIDRLRAHSLLADAGLRSKPQLTVYYDTKPAALRKRGYTLRVRESDGRFVQAIKPLTASAGLVSRTEIERSVKSIEPDLRSLTGTPLEPLLETGQLDRLKPIVRSEVLRSSWTVEIGGSVIRIDMDEGEISADGRSQRFSELEMELVSGEPFCLLAAAKAIADRIPVRVGVLSKAERGERLARGSFDRISKSAPVGIDASMSVAAAFEVMVHACIKHYRLNEPLVIDGRRKEALHQARVAMRRLRSAFALFKTAIEDVEYQYLREELRWFTAQLGDARNLDVYLERDLDEDHRSGLKERRDQAYDRVIAAMNSQRFRMLMIELIGWTAFGPWRRGKRARKPVEHYASGRLDRLWHSVARIGHHVADLDEHGRHELRIQVKKIRYAIEFLRGLYPDRMADEKRFASSVEELQESLGKLNDLATGKSIMSAPSPGEDWLIGEPEERPLLREAERAFHDLREVGPFWRHPHRAETVPA